MKNTKNTGLASLAKELKVTRPKEQTPQEKGETFDRYTKDLKPTKDSGKVKVINKPETKKPTLASLKKSNASLLGYLRKRKVELDFANDKIAARDQHNGNLMKNNSELKKSLKTAEGIIAERDIKIKNCSSRLDEKDRAYDILWAEFRKLEKAVKATKRYKFFMWGFYSIAFTSLSLAATVFYLWRVVG